MYAGIEGGVYEGEAVYMQGRRCVCWEGGVYAGEAACMQSRRCVFWAGGVFAGQQTGSTDHC